VILEPEQINQFAYLLEWDPGGNWMSDTVQIDIAQTPKAYATLVQKVADDNPMEFDARSDDPNFCHYCKVDDSSQPVRDWREPLVHEPDCLWVQARKLRGLELIWEADIGL
jgi:hypothetical protein